MDLALIKKEARKAAFLRRSEAHTEEASIKGAEHLLEVIMPYKGKSIAGYMPIRTEINPVGVMAALSAFGPVSVPVIKAKDTALEFALWDPGTKMVEGDFGASIPETLEFVEPDVLIVPLVAFDRKGGRLGYGGGFYDRTLERLREKRPAVAIGYAYGAQEADDLPLEDTDQPLDLIVTEKEILRF